MPNSPAPSQEQTAYANLLFYGCWVGLTLMIITYIAYLTGIVEPHIHPAQIPQYWGKSVQHYLTVAHVPSGWGWTSLIGTGDFMNFIGIVVLAGMSILCYIRIIPILFRKKDRLMLTVAVLEVIVLIVAASGVFGSGGH